MMRNMKAFLERIFFDFKKFLKMRSDFKNTFLFLSKGLVLWRTLRKKERFFSLKGHWCLCKMVYKTFTWNYNPQFQKKKWTNLQILQLISITLSSVVLSIWFTRILSVDKALIKSLYFFKQSFLYQRKASNFF